MGCSCVGAQKEKRKHDEICLRLCYGVLRDVFRSRSDLVLSTHISCSCVPRCWFRVWSGNVGRSRAHGESGTTAQGGPRAPTLVFAPNSPIPKRVSGRVLARRHKQFESIVAKSEWDEGGVHGKTRSA